MTTINISTWVDVDVDLSEIEDDELIEELESRGIESSVCTSDELKSLLTSIWLKRRTGKDFTRELDDLIYHSLGKII